MQILAILSIPGHECRLEISTCGVVIQYVYCSCFAGFSSLSWYLLRVREEMKDSTRAIFLWGDSLQTQATEIQPVIGSSLFLYDNMEILTFLWL